jgi:hypothetical protein
MPTWYIHPEQAKHYKIRFDNGPGSFMARYRGRTRKLKVASKPDGIPLNAWIYLAGPFSGHRVVVGFEPKKGAKKAVDKLPNSMSAECLRMLIANGYEKSQANDLINRCILRKRYNKRDSMVGNILTLPDKPGDWCTKLMEWLKAIKSTHPPLTT